MATGSVIGPIVFRETIPLDAIFEPLVAQIEELR